MRLEVVPLLGVIRDLYAQPRDMKRFRAYIATLTAGGDEADLPPLGLLNPMGKDRAQATLDALAALDAEGIAREAVADANRRLARSQAVGKIGLTIGDDVQGSWTSRWQTDAGLRFSSEYSLKRGWTSVAFFTSETPTRADVRERTLAAAYRYAWQSAHGTPATLRDALAQEGRALAFAGNSLSLGAEAISLVRARIAPHLAEWGPWTTMPALYGDEIAKSLGHEAWGIPPFGGFELALADAISSGKRSEDSL